MTQALTDDVRARFWARVYKTQECWNWRLSKGQHYGQLSIKRRFILAHRLSYWIHTGQHPGGKMVLHKCDNPACVRPDHLVLGTHMDNMLDKILRERQARGKSHGRVTKPHRTARHEQHGGSKVTWQIVYAIRQRALGGEKHSSIARDVCLCQITVSRIVSGRTWRKVGDAAVPSGRRRCRGRSLSSTQHVALVQMLRAGASTREAARAFDISQVTAWRAKQQGATL